MPQKVAKQIVRAKLAGWQLGMGVLTEHPPISSTDLTSTRAKISQKDVCAGTSSLGLTTTVLVPVAIGIVRTPARGHCVA